MNQTLYGLFLAIALGLAGALTTGATQTTLLVAAVAATAALVATTVVAVAVRWDRNRAKDGAS